MEEAVKRAYRRGYEDGYGQGCMDLLDPDFGEDAHEASGAAEKDNGCEDLQMTWDEYESHEEGCQS